jgi:hypothetical protein
MIRMLGLSWAFAVAVIATRAKAPNSRLKIVIESPPSLSVVVQYQYQIGEVQTRR